MSERIVTVFGGTGFLGGRVVERLIAHGFAVRIASRHPARTSNRLSDSARTDFVRADINDEASISKAVKDAYGVVNAVSLYAENDRDTFHSVHVEAAARLAHRAQDAGVAKLVQISGIGSDPDSRSSYIRSRGKGEHVTRAAFPDAILIRPAVMFGPGDRFLEPMCDLLRRFPVFALFGRGKTKLQPVYVGDAAEAIARAMGKQVHASWYELGGPQIYTYRSLIEFLSLHIGRHPSLVPVPFFLWHAFAHGAKLLPRPPITHNQIELMQRDTIVSDEAPGLASLEIKPTSLEEVLDKVRDNSRQT